MQSRDTDKPPDGGATLYGVVSKKVKRSVRVFLATLLRSPKRFDLFRNEGEHLASIGVEDASHVVIIRYFTLFAATLTTIATFIHATFFAALIIELEAGIALSIVFWLVYAAQLAFPKARSPIYAVFFLSVLAIMGSALINKGSVASGAVYIPNIIILAFMSAKPVERIVASGTVFTCIAICILSTNGVLGIESALAGAQHSFQHAAQLVAAAISTIILIDFLTMDHRFNTEKLVTQNLELEHAINARRQFIAFTRHELRTPMNAIIGSLDAIPNERDPEQRENLVDIAHDAALNLSTQLDDFLDMSAVEAGVINLEPHSSDISHLTENTLKIWRPEAVAKGLSLTYTERNSTKENLLIDPVRYQQILFVLLANAIKFTSAGDVRVALLCRPLLDDKAAIILSVDDTGAGMDKSRLKKISDALKSESTQRKNGQSLGLGLTMLRNLVRAMNGRITIESNPNTGSVFTVYLTAKTSKNTGQLNPSLLQFFTGKRILCVDDHAINLRLVELMFSKFGCDVECASSGEDALERCAKHGQFDLILMDIMMPGLDGVETTEQIRDGNTNNKDTPIYALTTNTAPYQVQRYENAGMDGVLHKPLDAHQIYSVLKTLWGDDDASPISDEGVA